MPRYAAIVLSFALTTAVLGQELELTDGTIVPGAVAKVVDNRVQVRTPEGRVLRFETRRVASSRDAAGRITRYPAQLLERAESPVQTTLFDGLAAGRDLELGDLMVLTEDCTVALSQKLVALTEAKRGSTRTNAARALALVAAPETVAVALALALGEEPPAFRRAVAEALTGTTAIAALEAANLTADVEKGLADDDGRARFSFAWIAAHLGSEAAVAILEPYVRDSDHHVRESVAVLLAERGRLAGLEVLLTILGRRTSPALRANARAPESVRQAIAASDLSLQVHICRLLGELRAGAAKATLKKLERADEPRLAEAAKEALARLEA